MNVHTRFDIANGQSSPELWAGTTRLVGGKVPDEFRVIKWHMLARTRAGLQVGAKNPRAVLVTSARPNEGKTFVAHNLVTSLALGDETDVTLIDKDFGNPGLPTTGLHGHHRGLLDVLANDDLD